MLFLSLLFCCHLSLASLVPQLEPFVIESLDLNKLTDNATKEVTAKLTPLVTKEAMETLTPVLPNAIQDHMEKQQQSELSAFEIKHKKDVDKEKSASLAKIERELAGTKDSLSEEQLGQKDDNTKHTEAFAKFEKNIASEHKNKVATLKTKHTTTVNGF